MMTKEKRRNTLLIGVFLTSLSVICLLFVNAVTTRPNKNLKITYNVNPTDSCIISKKISTKGFGFLINGNNNDSFFLMKDRDFNYLVSKNSGIKISNTSDTAYYFLAKYEVNKYMNEIFYNQKSLGNLKKGNYIILWNKKRIDVYDKERVRFVNVQHD
jgi:hypothetical protein